MRNTVLSGLFVAAGVEQIERSCVRVIAIRGSFTGKVLPRPRSEKRASGNLTNNRDGNGKKGEAREQGRDIWESTVAHGCWP